jgi:UDP-glucose 4-epimerase
MRILVTGGAGYVGSFATRRLIASGHDVVVVDDLSSGHTQAVGTDCLVQGDFGDSDFIKGLLKEHDIQAVMHFAASTGEQESARAPARYYRNNVINTLSLLNAMLECDVKKFVFSSSAAIYDAAVQNPLSENCPFKPESCYARTKLAIEYALEDFRIANALGYVSLRYFNAAGCDQDAQFGEDHRPETHLIPIVLQVALRQRDDLSLLGTDFDTPDGTSVRDYVHVEDIAEAHRLTLESLETDQAMIYNVGTGIGSSVLDVVRAAEEVTGISIPTRIKPRRPGDWAMRVAGSEKIQQELGWKPQYKDIVSIVRTAWAWHSSHPNGYEDSIE